MTGRLPLTLLCLLGTILVGAAPRSGEDLDPIERVREGVRLFEQGEFEAAAAAFSDASVARPEDSLITFDRGSVALAQGDWDRAIELLQEASLARDTPLATRALYNLATLSLVRARELFGERPEDAEEEVMTEGIELLQQAIGRYRDCLRLDPDHGDARHNLELIRMWLKHMRVLWEERARQEKRDQLDAVAFVQWIHEQQTGIRHGSRVMRQRDDTPQRRQSVRDLAAAQRQLEEELPFLVTKVEQLLDQMISQQGAQMTDDQRAQLNGSLDGLVQLVEQTADAMSESELALSERDLVAADPPQRVALEKLDEIFVALAEFGKILGRAIADQEGILKDTRAAAAVEDPDDERSLPDVAYLADRQGEMAHILQGLLFKANGMLPRLEESLAAQPPPAEKPTEDDESNDVTPTEEDPQAKARENLEASIAACQAAVELVPKTLELSDDAATRLGIEGATEEVTALQEEILKLLREIQEKLPKQESSDEQESGDGSEDQPPEDSQSEEQKPQDPSEQDEESPSKDSDPSQSEQEPQEESPGDASKQPISPQQIEALLREAREREDDYRERKKALLQQLGRRKAKKDW